MTTKRAKRRGTKPLSKAAAQYRHACRRAEERYGILLNKDSYLLLCKQIQDGKAVHLGKQSNRLTVWRVTAMYYSGELTANVVYDKQRHRIVTFLPKDITDAKGVSLAGEEPAPEEIA